MHWKLLLPMVVLTTACDQVKDLPLMRGEKTSGTATHIVTVPDATELVGAAVTSVCVARLYDQDVVEDPEFKIPYGDDVRRTLGYPRFQAISHESTRYEFKVRLPPFPAWCFAFIDRDGDKAPDKGELFGLGDPAGQTVEEQENMTFSTVVDQVYGGNRFDEFTPENPVPEW